VRSNIIAVNNILVLRASSSVENLSGVSDQSLQAIVLEDTPRPVPMHTLPKTKELHVKIVDTYSHGFYIMNAHPLQKAIETSVSYWTVNKTWKD
jgi:hypothetical protein